MAINPWKQTTLSEAVSLQRGHDLPEPERTPGDVPIMGSFGLTGWHNTVKCRGPGVTVGRSGASFGVVSYVDRDYWPLNTALYVTDFHGNDERFVYYLLKTIDFTAYNTGSAQPSLNRNHLANIAVSVPVLSEQRAITEVLGSLDDKIEQNRRTGRKLEALARAVFKAWFVDFEPVKAKAAGATAFPGMPAETFAALPKSLVDSELGPVPEGWTVGSIKDRAAVIQYGLTTSASQEQIGPGFLRITDIRGGSVEWGTVPYCAASDKDAQKYRLLDGDIVVARTGASTGENMYVVEPPNCVFASYLVRFQFADRGVGRMVGAFMRTDTYQSFVGNSIGGSAQPNANAQTLAGAKLVFPPPDISSAFYDFVRPLDLKRAADARESGTLAALRDYLLPRLLSGRVRVQNDTVKWAEATSA